MGNCWQRWCVKLVGEVKLHLQRIKPLVGRESGQDLHLHYGRRLNFFCLHDIFYYCNAWLWKIIAGMMRRALGRRTGKTSSPNQVMKVQHLQTSAEFILLVCPLLSSSFGVCIWRTKRTHGGRNYYNMLIFFVLFSLFQGYIFFNFVSQVNRKCIFSVQYYFGLMI